MDSKLRVAVDCRIADPRQGIGTALLAFAKALSESGSDSHEYTFIVREQLKGWLQPFVYGACKIQAVRAATPGALASGLRKLAPIRWLWRKVRHGHLRVPSSDGMVEAGAFDVVHFPTQLGYLTSLPTIYQPWDLQHLHHPGFFSKEEFAYRELTYRALCRQATFVCVQADWTRRDILSRYQLPGDKVVVVPWGSIFEAYDTVSQKEVSATSTKYGLPQQFLFYPAATWAHKNHECILEALSILKVEKGITPDVFFTGTITGYKTKIESTGARLGVLDQLHFLGFVEPHELQAMYRLATALVFPSRFEGFGLPVLESFHAGLPVICSNATTLPEVAGAGALYFSPDSPRELAGLIDKVMTDSRTREELVKKGASVLSCFSMKRTVDGLKDLYEKAASIGGNRGQPSHAQAEAL